MKTIMRKGQNSRIDEHVLLEEIKTKQHAHDRLVEKWSKNEEVIGDTNKFISEWGSHPDKIRNIACLLENQQTMYTSMMKRLGEVQTSNAFWNISPENLQRLIMLGYGKAVRGEAFSSFTFDTLKDTFFYLSPVYASTQRDAVEGDVTHESKGYRYPTENEIELVDAVGAGTNYTGTTTQTPVVAYKTVVIVDDTPVARDNGNGILETITGTAYPLDPASTNTINYTTGAYEITFLAAPNKQIDFDYHFDFEDPTNYPNLGEIELVLTKEQWRPRINALGITWSIMTELVLESNIGVQTENALMNGAADELTRALDFGAFREVYRYAKRLTPTTFNAEPRSVAESTIERAQAFSLALKQAGATISTALNRGGITVMFGGYEAVDYLEAFSKDFVSEANPVMIGIWKAGTYKGIPVYRIPTEDVMPKDEIIGYWNNPSNPLDVGVAIGTYRGLADPNSIKNNYRETPKLTYKQLYSEKSIYNLEEVKILRNGAYLTRIKINNIPTE